VHGQQDRRAMKSRRFGNGSRAGAQRRIGGPGGHGLVARSPLNLKVLAAATALAACLFLLPVAQAHAETEASVTVGPAAVSQALFVAGDVARLSKVPSGTEELVLEKALQQMYADEPELEPAVAKSYIGEMQALLSSSSAPSMASLQLMAGNQRVLAILAALERPHGNPSVLLAPAAKLAVTHLAAVALSGSSNIAADSEEPKYFEPLADARTNLTYTSFAPATVLRATVQLAGDNHRFGEARNDVWGAASEENVFSAWSELLRESKVLQSAGLKEIREKVEAGDGTITAEPAQLTALFSSGQKTTQEQSCEHGGGEEAIGSETISGIPRLKCSGGALYEAAHARACGLKTECEIELERSQSNAAKQARVIAEERAAMIAAAELLRPSDNTAAALQQATAQAQAQISEEETAYANYEAEKAEKEAIANGVKAGLGIGTSVLALGTGNYSEGIGGLINVGFELYENIEGGLSHPPPGPQEITLQDLADLSTQLAGFQQYTQEAFHAINTQLAELSSQFARENYELKEELGNLGERLKKEQGTVYALQDQVKELFAAQTKANLQTTIEDSVGWLRRTGEPLQGPKIQEALVALKKYATEIANGALVNNSETEPYTFEGAARQLTSKTTGEPAELDESITYLARFPGEQGWTGPSSLSSLANTTFWSESSRAYAQLMLENASHATAADIAGIKELEKEGLKLEQLEDAWSEQSASTSSQTGNTILNNALAEFEAASHGAGVDGTASVGTLLQERAEESAEKWLERNVKTASPAANPTDVNLWGGATQSFSASAVAAAEYPALKWEECSGSAGKNGKAEMPEGFIAGLPADLVDGVRLGVIGAPGSHDPLILKACRTLTKSVSETKTVKAARYEEECSVDVGNDCRVFYEAEGTNEKEAETATETLTLQAGEGGSTLTSQSVGECKQTALFWKGKGYLESWDPTTEGAYGYWVEHTDFGGAFEEERHVGSIYSLTFKGNSLSYSYGETAIEGTPCPAEGSEEKAGVEYADYNSAGNALGSVQSTIVEKVDDKLRELQKEAYGEDVAALKNPPKGDPAESVAGARALIQSYVKSGFPQAVDSDLTLQSDVEGLGAQFLDPEPGSPRPLPAQLTALVASWSKRLEAASGTKLSELVGEDLVEEVAKRSSAWAAQIAEQLKPYVEGKVAGFAAGEERVGEQSALVEATLNRLQLTRDVLTEAAAPTAETLAPSNVGTTEATVRGEVDPSGGVVESCIFEYGATEAYGHTVECSNVPGASLKAAVVKATISNWTPEGSFHERVVVKTWGGTSYGEDVKVQLAQSTHAPTGGVVLADTSTSDAAINGLTAEELPSGVSLPAGAVAIVGSLEFTVNVTPGGSVRVRLVLPEGSAPNALYKLRHKAGGGEEYVEIPSSLYTITGNTIELTLVDGGPDDEDGEVNGVIVDPLVPVRMTKPATTPPTETKQGCVRDGSATVQLSALKLPRGVTIAHSKLLLDGRVVATLGGRATAAVVKLGAARKGRFEVTVVAKLSDGKTLRRRILLKSCAPAPRPPECVRNGSGTIHLSALKLPRRDAIVESEFVLAGHVVARLGRHATGTVLNFAGLSGPPYDVTIVAKLSTGKTVRRRVVIRACAS